ncbi:MAG TPA: prolyl oligopeptidase family serine peptidase, partial [Anaerolineales bacterium]|nr:prolyl oligopeptidase family serine peptidase [Anaerolineales bacterium]
PGPHPAIVISHGSERGERNDFFREQLRTFFASQGIIALTYDKRGVGDSGGTYRESASEENLTLLAQDVLAGVGYLQTRPEVDGTKIGLIGGSQAGWVLPLAAQSEAVAFFIIISGPVVSTGIENSYSELTNDGDSPSQYTPEQISKQLAERTPYGFDPVPILATLPQPGLWLFGGVDQSIPVPESVVNLEALIVAGQGNFSYAVYPGLDHNLQVAEQGLFREIPFSSGFGEEVFARILAWVREVVE